MKKLIRLVTEDAHCVLGDVPQAYTVDIRRDLPEKSWSHEMGDKTDKECPVLNVT